VVHRPCANLVMVDHGDGWLTGYYHLAGLQV
jgi:murein DD-endopeptidase MepM/ murein hydrolase activator NlpD